MALLLQHRPHLEQPDDHGMTPLMWSARAGHLTLTRMLDHGANIHASDQGSRTSLHHAVYGHNPNLVALLIRRSVGIGARVKCHDGRETDLHYACSGSSSFHAQIVRIWLDAGADKDAPDGGRVTPLHLAAEKGNIDSSIINLIHFGAGMEADDANGRKPPHYAVHFGHPLAFQTLLDHGALMTKPQPFFYSTGT